MILKKSCSYLVQKPMKSANVFITHCPLSIHRPVTQLKKGNVNPNALRALTHQWMLQKLASALERERERESFWQSLSLGPRYKEECSTFASSLCVAWRLNCFQNTFASRLNYWKEGRTSINEANYGVKQQG
jgi:hypothetical protein